MSLPINAPSEPGLYWARARKSEFWDFIVRVAGKAPYLSIDFVWMLADGSKAKAYDVFAFGPKIEEPDTPVLESKER